MPFVISHLPFTWHLVKQFLVPFIVLQFVRRHFKAHFAADDK
jgi:hypothetical protein